MTSPGVDLSLRLIKAAEARLVCQRRVVAALPPGCEPDLLRLGCDLLALMEQRIVLMHREHRRLLEDSILAPFVPAE